MKNSTCVIGMVICFSLFWCCGCCLPLMALTFSSMLAFGWTLVYNLGREDKERKYRRRNR